MLIKLTQITCTSVLPAPRQDQKGQQAYLLHIPICSKSQTARFVTQWCLTVLVCIYQHSQNRPGSNLERVLVFQVLVKGGTMLGVMLPFCRFGLCEFSFWWFLRLKVVDLEEL